MIINCQKTKNSGSHGGVPVFLFLFLFSNHVDRATGMLHVHTINTTTVVRYPTVCSSKPAREVVQYTMFEVTPEYANSLFISILERSTGKNY